MGEKGLMSTRCRSFATLFLSALCAGCSVDMGGFAFVNDKTTSIRVTTEEPRLQPDGSCGAGASLDPSSLRAQPAEIANGISECDLIRLKGSPPTDVLIGESGKGQREVQVLYAEPGGREIYLFIDNKLTRIIKPGQG